MESALRLFLLVSDPYPNVVAQFSCSTLRQQKHKVYLKQCLTAALWVPDDPTSAAALSDDERDDVWR